MNKCLVKLDENNCIRSHNLLRDMGRQIASEQLPRRFWSPEQIHNIQISEAIKKIRGIIATATTYNGDSNHSSYWPSFQELTNLMGISIRGREDLRISVGLELLVVRRNDFNQESSQLWEDLIWLRWFESQHRNLPSWLPLRNLRALELHKAKALEEFWVPEALPLQLRELNITGASSFKTFLKSIGRLIHLKKLTLRGDPEEKIPHFAELPEEFCRFQSLEHLELRYCPTLSSLPSHFGALTNLKHIDLNGCKELRMLPVSFKQLTRPEYIDLSDCMTLSIPSDILDSITALETLNVFRYKELKEMPYRLTNQASMKEPNILENVQHYRLTNQVATRQVYVCGCTELHQIENQTRELIICKSIQKFRKSIGQLQRLEKIVVDGSVNTSLKALPEEFSRLKALRRFNLRWCRALTSLPRHFGNLTSLQHLDLSFWSQLKELPYSGKQFKLLQYLAFEGCSNLVIPPYILGKMTTLQHLNFKDGGKLRVLPTQVTCQLSLRSLNLVGTSLEELPNEVGMLISLEVLEIGSPCLTDLPVSMGNMINLQTLDVKGCTCLTCLPKSLLEHLTINAPQALKETLQEVVEETPNCRCVIW